MAAESKIEQTVCARALREYGVENIKLRANGWPDRLFLIPGGRALMIEFKAPGLTPEPLQVYVHGKLKKLGYQVETHDNVDQALQAIAKALSTYRKLS